MTDGKLAAIKVRLRKGYPGRYGLQNRLTVAKGDVADLVKRVEELEVFLGAFHDYAVGVLAKFDEPTAIGILRSQVKAERP